MLGIARATCARTVLDCSARRLRTFSSSPRIAFPRWINNRADGAQARRPTQSRGVSKRGQLQADASDSAGIAGSQRTVELVESDDNSAAPPAQGSSGGAAAPPSNGNDGNDNGESDDGHEVGIDDTPAENAERHATPTSAISKQSVPEYYPQLLALPIARRPLFPGYYKAVVVRNPSVVAAIEDMLRRGQAYMGAFLLKDENSDSDVITDIDSVHHVGVFAQITSVFPAEKKDDKGDDKDKALTVVLYPHRRIKLQSLVPGKNAVSAIVEAPDPSDESVSRDGQAHVVPRTRHLDFNAH